MLVKADQPTHEELISGWKIVRSGRAEVGDKYWRPYDRVWLPVVSGDLRSGFIINATEGPIIIRKER